MAQHGIHQINNLTKTNFKNMKKITVLFLFVMSFQGLKAQLNLTHPPVVDIINSNVFLDASKNFSLAAGAENNIGKGLVIPSVDLVNFEFIGAFLSSTDAPSFYDGMLVYNNATGTTLTTGNRSSTATSVTPGFYYFSNPNGATTENITGGVWTAMGAGGASSVKDITSTEIELPIKIDGEQLYAIKGTFTLNSASSTVTFTIPTGMTGYFSFVTYKDGKTFRRDINSLTISDTTATVVFGTGIYSEIIDADTYDYVLEYFK
jgi:hypothetical protein